MLGLGFTVLGAHVVLREFQSCNNYGKSLARAVQAWGSLLVCPTASSPTPICEEQKQQSVESHQPFPQSGRKLGIAFVTTVLARRAQYTNRCCHPT